jgi:hypothetical protein
VPRREASDLATLSAQRSLDPLSRTDSRVSPDSYCVIVPSGFTTKWKAGSGMFVM